MLRFCIVLSFVIIINKSLAQTPSIEFDKFELTGKVLHSSDSLLFNLLIANVGDTVNFASHLNAPIRGIIKSKKSVNHAVTNINIQVIANETTTLFVSYRRGLDKGKGFIGRMSQIQSNNIYTLEYDVRDGYYFEKKLKATVIAN